MFRQAYYLRPVLILLLSVGFTFTAQAQSAKEIAARLNNNWNWKFNQGQADQLAALYAEDALVSPSNGQVIQGREAIRDHFQGYFDAGLHNHRLDIVKVGGGDDWLYEIAVWRATGAPKNAVMPLYKGIATIIFEKNEKGEWRIQSHTWNLEPDKKS